MKFIEVNNFNGIQPDIFPWGRTGLLLDRIIRKTNRV